LFYFLFFLLEVLMREGTDGGAVLYSTQIMGGGSTPSVLRSALSDFLADVRNRDDVITFLSMKRRAGKRRSSISEDQATNGALVRCVPAIDAVLLLLPPPPPLVVPTVVVLVLLLLICILTLIVTPPPPPSFSFFYLLHQLLNS